MSKEFRVAEIFGPTIQGEGRNVGIPCHFVRFGGCDFRCTWCDTPHAVLPELVAQLPKMDRWKIFHEVNNLGNQLDYVRWVVLTGGNPGLLDLSELIDLFHQGHFNVMLETQGTTYRSWYLKVDDLCVSPKPPSAGNTTDLDLLQRIFDRMKHDRAKKLGGFLTDTWLSKKVYLKVPIFTDDDLDYAEDVHERFPELELFLSIGNADPGLPTVGNPNPDVPDRPTLTRDYVLDNFKDVVSAVLSMRPGLHDCRIFPQQHTLLWGNERGH